MPNRFILYSGFQLTLLIILFLVMAYLLHLFFARRLRGENKSGDLMSLPHSLTFGSILISSGLVLREVTAATTAALQILEKQFNAEALIMNTGKYMLYFTGIAILGFLLITGLTSYLFFLVRRDGIRSTLAKNDSGGAVVYSAALITFTLLSLDYLRQVMEAIIPYPEMPNLY